MIGAAEPSHYPSKPAILTARRIKQSEMTKIARTKVENIVTGLDG
jgi:hypothetical protein